MKPARAHLNAVLAALATLAASAPAAHAVEGNLYTVGIGAQGAHNGASVSTNGSARQVNVPFMDPARAGNVYEALFTCPVPGSEIAAVHFGGLRTELPSSLEVRVTGNRVPLWAEGDVLMPRAPSPGRAYGVELPGGHCHVHLSLTQVETRRQHARVYFLDAPRALVRDLTAPAVAIRAITPGWLRGGSFRVEWSASDNFGSDGIAQQRIVVAGAVRWAGAPGQGDHGVDVSLSGIPDGVHAVHVQADGDGTPGGAASGTVHVDRTAPSASGLAVRPGGPGRADFTWTASDNVSGVAASHVEVNTAPDGSTGGEWRAVASAPGGGHRSLSGVRVDTVPDGVHAWRVRLVDAAGNVSVAPGPGRVVVDTNPPALELHAPPSGWVNRLSLDVSVADNLQDALGLGPMEIDVNAAPDGGEGGEWVRAATIARGPGRREEAIDLTPIADGRHLVRVRARNGAPYSDALVAERRAVVRVDRTPPALGRVRLTPRGATLTAAWSASDTHAGVASAALQWRDGGSWRTFAADAATDGAGSLVADLRTVPAGERVVRLLVGDGAGNGAAHTTTLRLAGAGVGSAAGDPIARLRTARLALRMPGAPARWHRGRAQLVRTVRYGGRVTVAGRLRDRAGRPIGGAEVVVRGHGGAHLGRTITRADGGFRAHVSPDAGGVLRVGVPVGRALLPARPVNTLRVRVRPRLLTSASAVVVGPGREVVFAGRLLPSPTALGLGRRKAVVLEWRDPIRGTWRPVVNATVGPDGRFAIPWRFGVRGLTIPMRVSVPGELGWPLTPVRSRVIPVVVR